MCLIVVKPKGLPMPGKKSMKRWFRKYPDGFGLAFQNKRRVRILKGAMDIHGMFHIVSFMRKYLEQENKAVEDVDVIMQFRLAVTGCPCPEFCHPFPITKKRKLLNGLDVLAGAALAHNGTIWEYSKAQWEGGWTDINDAQEFIHDYLADMGDSIWNVGVQTFIGEYTLSKYALLSNSKIAYIGDFIEDRGYFYSNDGYLKENSKQVPPKHNPAALSVYGANWDSSGWEGSPCDFCKEHHALLYQLPDDESNVCWECFEYHAGRTPRLADRAV